MIDHRFKQLHAANIIHTVFSHALKVYSHWQHNAWRAFYWITTLKICVNWPIKSLVSPCADFVNGLGNSARGWLDCIVSPQRKCLVGTFKKQLFHSHLDEPIAYYENVRKQCVLQHQQCKELFHQILKKLVGDK